MGLRFFDLFAGIGGFRLALERNNHICIGSCEIDKYARETYKKNFGEYPIYTDAKNIIHKHVPDFDILCAGFPCQAFSFAGKRHGFEDIRGTLFYEIVKLAKAKQPKLLFLENVKGLLNHDNGRTFSTILSTFDALGYDTEWQIINSKYFVPQNRERIFIIGHIREESSRKIFPLGDCNRINDETRRETQSEGSRVRSRYSRTIDANYLKGGGSRTMIAYSKTLRRGKWARGEDSVEIRYKEGISNTLLGGDGCSAQATMTLVGEPKIDYINPTASQGYRVARPTGIGQTLAANAGGLGAKCGLTTQYDRIRKLTPKECERLQGFPDDWTEGVSDSQRYKQCGNAVTVDVVEYITKHL